MSSTEPPTTRTPSGRRSWGSRLRSRGVVIGAVIVALVVIGGIVAALLVPDRAWRFGPGYGPGFGPGIGRDAWTGDRDGGWHERGGPWRGDRHGPFGFADGPVVAGTVTAVGDGTMTVAVDGDGPRTLRTDSGTRVVGEGNSGLGDLQNGERVVVRVEGSGDAATAVTVWTPQARVAGTVTALSGDTATVVSVDGLAVRADVSALSQKPTVGDVVVLTGIAADGSTIRADGIRVLPRAS